MPRTTSDRGHSFSVASAAEYLGVSDKTIRRFIASGRLPAYRVGPKLLRISKADLDRLLQRVPTGRVA